VNLGELKARVWERVGEDSSDPKRYSAVVVREMINDGIQRMVAKTGCLVTTTTISQRPGVLAYALPSDCIRVLSVRHDDTADWLYPAHWREFDAAADVDRRQVRNVDIRRRWMQMTSVRSTNWLAFGLNEIWLWPLVADSGKVTAADVSTVMDEAYAGAATVTMAGTHYGGIGVWVNGVRLERVSAPATNAWEFSLSDETITFGVVPESTDRVALEYNTASEDLVLNVTPSGTQDGANTDFTLTVEPSAVGVYLNGIRQTEYTLSTDTITFTTAPDAADYITVDYITDDTSYALGETPSGTQDGSNRNFTLASLPGSNDLVAVYVNGVRLGRSSAAPDDYQFSISGQTITLGSAPSSTDTVLVDYVKTVTVADAETYTVTYLADAGSADLILDSETPSVPEPYHAVLVDYAVGLCLLFNARGDRAKVAMSYLQNFADGVERCRQSISNLGAEWSITPEAIVR